MPIGISTTLYRDLVLALEIALEEIPDECNCDAYMEQDTGAWIHQEDKCRIYNRDHIDCTLVELKKALPQVAK